MKRHIVLLVSLLQILIVCQCTVTRKVQLEDELAAPGRAIHRPAGQSIVGYTTADGEFHRYSGFVTVLSPDTLGFYHDRPSLFVFGGDTYPGKLRMHRSAVSSVTISKTSSVAKFILIPVAVIGIGAAIVALTKESCPFIYSWDGQRYVFDGEPYGGATMQSLERTDASELERLVEDHGTYRLRLTNEVDETQHTNSLALTVVDHRPGLRVVMDPAGVAHGFRQVLPLVSARDAQGRDVSHWLRTTDQAVWYPDLGVAALRDSLTVEDTRDHLTLEFPRPKSAKHAYLLANVATGQWGSHMIRTMLGMRGTRVGEFYDAVNTNPVYQSQLLAWNDREELYHLSLQIEKQGGWVRAGVIPGGGPYLAETRAIPLDLDGVEGDFVRVRLDPPIGFWALNSFELAASEESLDVRIVHSATARNVNGKDEKAALLSDDGSYVDFPVAGDRIDLTFDAPTRPAGTERSIFAQTRGWYEVHLHELGAPDTVGLTRLASEPGYAVRRALREYREFTRTGVLAGTAAAPAPSIR